MFPVMQSVRDRLYVMSGSLQNSCLLVPGSCASEMGLCLSKTGLLFVWEVKEFDGCIFGP